MSGLPLAQLKVLDLSRLLPGPYATLLLADLGATVDKVEDPDGGDYLRQLPPLRGAESALFLGLNRNKRSLALDLKSPGAQDALRRMVRHYDVLVESFRPGVMDRLGLGEAVLRAENPRLIYCAISGYGQTGPDRLKAGHDLNYVARAGVLGYGGEANGPPAFLGAQIGDIGGGSLFAVIGILAALQERAQTGRGRLIDVSMTDGATAFVHLQLAARLALGEQGRPLQRGVDALNGGFPGYGVFRTRDDRYLAVAALEPKFFSTLCEKLGRPELVEAAYGGGSPAEDVKRILEQIFAGETLEHWVQRFAGCEVCVEPVLEGDELLNDPQLVARGLVRESKDPERGPLQQLMTPLRFGEIPLRPPPRLGQHNAEILREAGFSDPEISALT